MKSIRQVIGVFYKKCYNVLMEFNECFNNSTCSMEESVTLTHTNQVNLDYFDLFTLRWDNQATRLSVGSSNCQVNTLTPEFAISHSFLCQMGREKMPITSLRYRPEYPDPSFKPLLLATSSDGGIVHWNSKKNKIFSFKRLRDEQIYTSDYSNDGSQYILGCKDSIVKQFDQETFEEIGSFCPYTDTEASGAQRVFCVKWFDEHCFLSAGWNDKVSIWDFRAKLAIRELLGPHICGDAVDVKGNLLVTGSYDVKDQFTVWDWTNGRTLYTESLTYNGNTCYPYCVQFFRGESNTVAVAGAGVNEVYFFNAGTGKRLNTLSNLSKSVFCLHISSRNQLALGVGNTVEVYQIN